MQKIYVVEDDDNIRDLVVYALRASDFDVAGFESGAEMRKKTGRERPGLIILDIMLPEEDGLSILKDMKNHAETKSVPVILLTAKSSEYDRIKGLDLGADDYISKPFSVLELLSRVRAVLRRMSPAEAARKLSLGCVEMDVDKRTVTSEGEAVTLTYKEFEVLYCMMSKKDTVFSRDRLMELVWGFDFEGESRTVDMHIKTLRQKLKKGGEMIKTIRGVGYKIGE